MQKSSPLFPAEVLMWSLLAQCERQIFDHEMPPPPTAEIAGVGGKSAPPKAEEPPRQM